MGRDDEKQSAGNSLEPIPAGFYKVKFVEETIVGLNWEIMTGDFAGRLICTPKKRRVKIVYKP